MDVEEGNGESLKPEESSREGLITYKRKRARSSSRRDQVVCSSSRKERIRDIGWDHGEIIDGNRFHWMCNWCGLIRYGGGVSRLKKHLAGVCHVRKCPNVPEDIAKLMMNHLMEKRKERVKKLSNRSACQVNLIDHDNQSRMLSHMESKASLSNKAEKTGTTVSTNGIKKQEEIISKNSKGVIGVDRKARVGSTTGIMIGVEINSGSGLGAMVRDENVQKPCSPRKSDYKDQLANTTKFSAGAGKTDTQHFLSAQTSNIQRQDGSIDLFTKERIFRPKLPLKRSMRATQQSKTSIQSPKTNIFQGLSEIHDKGSCKSTYEQHVQGRKNYHWRKVLEHVLKWLGSSEGGGGITNCIHDALTYGRYGSVRKCDTVNEKGTHAVEFGLEGQHQKPDDRVISASCASKIETFTQTHKDTNTTVCQKILLDILCSEDFAFLCDFFWINFQESSAKFFFDFSLINSRMKSGEYEHSPGLFSKDIQQVWDKFQEAGRQMLSLASSLSNMSHVSSEKLAGGDLVREDGEDRAKETCQVGLEKRKFSDSYVAAPSTCEPRHSFKPDEMDGSCINRACTCKQCGVAATVDSSLMCHGCKGRYHFLCAEPAIRDPTSSWYCTACSMHNTGSYGQISVDRKQGSLRKKSVVCDRLEVSGSKEERGKNYCIHSESSISSMDSDKAPELSRTALSCLCKICGTCETDDKKFLLCGHNQCPYKFYHIRCLKSSQIASHQQQNRPYWYCPSCLCRACLCDKDDDQIVLCDGCDDAYHTYCMRPPRSSIPKGQWYCVPCDIAGAKGGMKSYEWILQQLRNDDTMRSSEANRSMDLLLSAAEKLKSEEQVAQGVDADR